MTKEGRATIARLALLGVVVAALLLAAKLSGIATRFTAEGLRETIKGAGTWGALLFIAIFAVGQLAHVPCTLFYLASVFSYGRLWGGAVSYLGSLVSVSLSFAFVRAIGGQPIAGIKSPVMRRLLVRLDQRPLAVMALLRFIFWTAPALNYTLALSQIRFAPYLASTAIGLVLPLVAISALYGVLFH